jgi:hypothetical protein
MGKAQSGVPRDLNRALGERGGFNEGASVLCGLVDDFYSVDKTVQELISVLVKRSTFAKLCTN